MEFDELKQRILLWAEEREILSNSTPKAQLLKAVSELGELCDAEIKDSWLEQKDAIGDVLVCLIIYCGMKDYDIEQCLSFAYEEIRHRKGKMIAGGAFVKEE